MSQPIVLSARMWMSSPQKTPNMAERRRLYAYCCCPLTFWGLALRMSCATGDQLSVSSDWINSICATQFLGAPLYWINRDLYYSYMALTKQSFGILITTTTQWLSPTFVRISGDESVSGQMRKTEDGRLECSFPERMVMIANHQVKSIFASSA
jgi:hypothetical protein